MSLISLKYGNTSIGHSFDSGLFSILEADSSKVRLSDVEIGLKLDAPISSPCIEDLVSQGEKVLFVVPDATRRTGAGQLVNLIVRRLIANGTAPHEMAALIATGIHRGVTEEEKREILTPFIVQRLKVFEHSARDLMKSAGLESDKFVHFGETDGGIPIRLNRMLTEYDRVITIGGVAFHYFAGFTGGRKLICPGLAAEETVTATHSLAFDFNLKTRRAGVGSGLLAGNAVHEAFVEVARNRPADFSINTIVNDEGDITDLYCGDWIASHEAACEAYAEEHTAVISEKRDVVIASCGGFPHDINVIQAHKALDSAADACRDGGIIVLLAECSDGLGRADFLDWFSAPNSEALAERLCEGYQVNGQTAWSLLKKTERFDVRIVTDLSAEVAFKMGFKRFESIEAALGGIPSNTSGYILPKGAKIKINQK